MRHASPRRAIAAAALVGVGLLAMTNVANSQVGGDEVRRLFGDTRFETANELSFEAWKTQGAFSAVLARADVFADALAGTPLAVANEAPILLTGSGALDPVTAEELTRAVPLEGTVFLLGGTAALSPQVESDVKALGYENVVRFAGADRFETAIKIAEGLGNPGTFLLTTGLNFPDGLAAGAAAGANGGAVLLTQNETMPNSVKTYLDRFPAAKKFAIGGQAVKAAPTATPVFGADRFATAIEVAKRFYEKPPSVVVVSGIAFPDALSAGPYAGYNAYPMVLSLPNELPGVVSGYLGGLKADIKRGIVAGGPNAVSDAVLSAVAAAIT